MTMPESGAQTKFFEIRDRATFIPAMATLIFTDNMSDSDRYIVGRAGFRGYYLILTTLYNMKTQYNRYNWPLPARTMGTAHGYIEDNWQELESGEVIDVEYLLGESSAPKTSERLEYFE